MIQAGHTIDAGKEPETIRALLPGFTGARSVAPEMGHAKSNPTVPPPLGASGTLAFSDLVADVALFCF